MIVAIIGFMFFVELIKTQLETDNALEDAKAVQTALGVVLIAVILTKIFDKVVF